MNDTMEHFNIKKVIKKKGNIQFRETAFFCTLSDNDSPTISKNSSSEFNKNLDIQHIQERLNFSENLKSKTK